MLVILNTLDELNKYRGGKKGGVQGGKKERDTTGTPAEYSDLCVRTASCSDA